MKKKGIISSVFNLIKGSKVPSIAKPYSMENLIADLAKYDSKSVADKLDNFSIEELNKGYKENAKITHYPIFVALGSDDKAFDKMVAMGIDIHGTDKKGNNLFMHAVETGAFKSLDKIKKLGVDINVPNKEGDFPTHAAARRLFNRKFVLKLAELGADFAKKDAKGRKASSILSSELKSTSKKDSFYVPTKTALRAAKKAERNSLRFN